jgi:hypothetical protein
LPLGARLIRAYSSSLVLNALFHFLFFFFHFCEAHIWFNSKSELCLCFTKSRLISSSSAGICLWQRGQTARTERAASFQF